MAKRGATSELNHDNWDREEPPEIAGTFQKASNDIMQRRIVKVAKRRSTGLSDQSAAKNVFSGFQGFKTDISSKPTVDLSSTSSSLKSSKPTVSPSANGVTIQSQFSINTGVSSSTNNAIVSDTSAAIQSSKMNNLNEKSSDKYPAKLIRLNQCVAEWIKSHVDKDPSCILTPIFKDYERYLKEIEDERTRNASDKKDYSFNQTNLISSSCIPAAFSFKLDQRSDNTDNINSNSENVPSSSPATGSKATSPSNSLFSLFKTDASKKSSPVSSLLAKPDPAALMMDPFTSPLKKSQDHSGKSADDAFKAKGSDSMFKIPQDSAAGGFSFISGRTGPFGGSSNTSSTSSNENSGKQSNDNNDGDGEESDEPPKADFKPIQEEDAVFNKRCKVFIKKENNYADLGVGTLFIKPVVGEKHQLLVRADTSLGNILVNVLLTSAIPTQRMGKNNVMIICVPTPPAVGVTKQPTPSTVLLRVKTAEEADELLKVLEKYKKS